jgi:hypothetical protein
MDKPYNSAINKKRTNPHKNVKKEPRSLHQYIINNVQFVLGYIQEEYLKECLMTMATDLLQNRKTATITL